jgi:hypothetical protein
MVSLMRARQAAVLGALALGTTLQCVSADTRQNPYQPIVERNAFGLKDPPPPPSTDTKEDAKPPPNVKLTGISNLFQKRALLEVTEQGTAKPGQPASGTVYRPILAETEGAFGVEVLSIDVEKNIVRIRNNGAESDLTFEAPKLSGGPASGALGNQGQPSGQPPRGASINSAAEQQPMVISSQNAQTTGGGGVTMLGGSTTAGAPNNSGVSTYGGTTPSVPSPLGTDGGLRTIPSRTIRTPTGGTEQQPVDPAQQAIMMEAQRLRQQQQQQQGQGYKGRPGPPIPPTQLTPPAPQQQ